MIIGNTFTGNEVFAQFLSSTGKVTGEVNGEDFASLLVCFIAKMGEGPGMMPVMSDVSGKESLASDIVPVLRDIRSDGIVHVVTDAGMHEATQEIAAFLTIEDRNGGSISIPVMVSVSGQTGDMVTDVLPRHISRPVLIITMNAGNVRDIMTGTGLTAELPDSAEQTPGDREISRLHANENEMVSEQVQGLTVNGYSILSASRNDTGGLIGHEEVLTDALFQSEVVQADLAGGKESEWQNLSTSEGHNSRDGASTVSEIDKIPFMKVSGEIVTADESIGAGIYNRQVGGKNLFLLNQGCSVSLHTEHGGDSDQPVIIFRSSSGNAFIRILPSETGSVESPVLRLLHTIASKGETIDAVFTIASNSSQRSVTGKSGAIRELPVLDGLPASPSLFNGEITVEYAGHHGDGTVQVTGEEAPGANGIRSYGIDQLETTYRSEQHSSHNGLEIEREIGHGEEFSAGRTQNKSIDQYSGTHIEPGQHDNESHAEFLPVDQEKHTGSPHEGQMRGLVEDISARISEKGVREIQVSGDINPEMHDTQPLKAHDNELFPDIDKTTRISETLTQPSAKKAGTFSGLHQNGTVISELTNTGNRSGANNSVNVYSYSGDSSDAEIATNTGNAKTHTSGNDHIVSEKSTDMPVIPAGERKSFAYRFSSGSERTLHRLENMNGRAGGGGRQLQMNIENSAGSENRENFTLSPLANKASKIHNDAKRHVLCSDEVQGFTDKYAVDDSGSFKIPADRELAVTREHVSADKTVNRRDSTIQVSEQSVLHSEKITIKGDIPINAASDKTTETAVDSGTTHPVNRIRIHTGEVLNVDDNVIRTGEGEVNDSASRINDTGDVVKVSPHKVAAKREHVPGSREALHGDRANPIAGTHLSQLRESVAGENEPVSLTESIAAKLTSEIKTMYPVSNTGTRGGDETSEHMVLTEKLAVPHCNHENSHNSAPEILSGKGEVTGTDPLTGHTLPSGQSENTNLHMQQQNAYTHTDAREDSDQLNTVSSEYRVKSDFARPMPSQPASEESSVWSGRTVNMMSDVPSQKLDGTSRHSVEHTEPSGSVQTESDITGQKPVIPITQNYEGMFEGDNETGVLDSNQHSGTRTPGMENLSHDTQHDTMVRTEEGQIGIHHTAEKTELPLFDTGTIMNHGRTAWEAHGEVLDSIVRHASIMLQKGQSSAIIRLEPPNLGRVKLEIVTEQSKVTGKITVESIEIKEVIDNRLAELRENLAQNGLKVESFDVQVGHNSGTDNWARREDFERLGMSAGAFTGVKRNASDSETPAQNSDTAEIHRLLHTGIFEVWI